MLPSDYKSRTVRPMSEVINPGRFLNEVDIAGNWYEDLQKYESNLDEMASATLDQNFKEEMQHVDQWYRYLTEAEKTATMYTLLQHSTQVQARFFINLLQQMVKRDPLFSLLTPNNPDQDMQNHLAGAMAKAELEASQRLMSVLPYKTGQVISRPPSNTNRRTVDRHSFALGDTEEYSRLFSSGGRSNSNDFLNPSHAAAAGAGGRSSSPYVNSLLDDNSTNARRLANSNRNSGTSGRTMFNNGGRPHSVIEGDTSLLFPTSSNSSNWLNANNSNSNARRVISPGHIGDRPSSKLIERPKSADISNWSLPTEPMDRRSTSNNGFSSVWNNTQQQATIPEFVVDNDLIDFTNSFNQQSFRNSASRRSVNRIPAVVPESADELIKSTQDLFLDNNYARSNNSKQQANAPPGMEHYSNYLLTQQQQQPQPSLQSIVDNSNNHLYVSSASNNHNNNHENGYLSDHSDGSYMSRRRSSSMVPSAANNSNQTRASKDKKAVEVIDMELLKDIPAWLRSLRLHKYNTIFSDSNWQTIVKMSDEDLLAKGVAALGARRKMLKVFENVRAHCDANHIEY